MGVVVRGSKNYGFERGGMGLECGSLRFLKGTPMLRGIVIKPTHCSGKLEPMEAFLVLPPAKSCTCLESK